MQKIIVAIDGYASTGKSSLAKQLAETLNYTYIDSGAMYRAVTYFAIQKGHQGHIDKEKLITQLDQIEIYFKYSKSGHQTFLNGLNISKEIRLSEVTEQVSRVSKIIEVRELLVTQQQKLGAKKDIIMDGRDIGTVVFPKAECKFFLKASSEIRAKRRHLEQIKAGNNESFASVLSNIKDRDLMDTTRKLSPLTKADDAIGIDVSEMSLEEVYQQILEHISKKII
jgi:cytidylate kinase